MEDNWSPAFSLPECVPDGCVYMHSAAYEFWIMMDGRVKSKEHESVYTRTRYISIHLLLMQQPHHWGSGTLCWHPNESWVIYHVESQSSSPACMPYTTPSSFFFISFYLLVLLFPSLRSFYFSIISSSMFNHHYFLSSFICIFSLFVFALLCITLLLSVS